ncbi:hypothetical protein BHM03_00013034 [Ensete ventricosum]|uniref:Uncharacterized protein n=1 Tax=Ensete ventricosum TaxID=4639 RepID=A0A445MDU8_ENSVE|nr:hypothetical protein BHM03_00013034 [Ensete ventricosum]
MAGNAEADSVVDASDGSGRCGKVDQDGCQTSDVYANYRAGLESSDPQMRTVLAMGATAMLYFYWVGKVSLLVGADATVWWCTKKIVSCKRMTRQRNEKADGVQRGKRKPTHHKSWRVALTLPKGYRLTVKRDINYR